MTGGPPSRFEEVYEQHVVRIYRFIHARVGNRPDAEDLTAQVFLRAVEQLDTGRDAGQITNWLFRVSENAIADYWRAFYRLPVIPSEMAGPGWEARAEEPAAAEPDDAGRAARVEWLLQRLPATYRRVLELRFLERRSVADTAREMGVSNGNARVLQYRALRKAALLQEPGDG